MVTRYVSPYTIQLKVFIATAENTYKWIWMRDCYSIKEVRSTCKMLDTARMNKLHYRIIRNNIQ